MNEDSAGDAWEKAETSSRISFYVNHKGKRTRWENPKYASALESLNECNSIKYAAYRTAAKMCVLQKTLGLDLVRLGIVAGVFQRHRFQAMENGLTLDHNELEAIMSDIYFAASKESHRSVDVDHFTELSLYFLFNCFDKGCKGSLQVLSAKTALVSLCSSRLQEKYEYLFAQLADHNNCLVKRKLKILLENFVCLTDYLSESLAFSSSLITSTISSCYEQSHGPLGISEEAFMRWVLREPQLLVWFSTFYRLRAAEKVNHSVRCAVCRMYPICGLRYRCLHCISYDQCQACFFHGRTSKRHKLKHPMQEYCWQTSPKEATVSFLKALVNRLCGNTSRLQYLPAQPSDSATSTPSISTRSVTGIRPIIDAPPLESDSEWSPCDSTIQPQQELQSIISKLEAENRQLEVDIQKLCGAGQNHVGQNLEEHRALLEAQVRRLKILMSHLQTIGPKYTQSTPKNVHHNGALTVYRSPDFSPILSKQEADFTCRDNTYNSGLASCRTDTTPGALSTWFGGDPSRCDRDKHASNFSDWLGDNKRKDDNWNHSSCGSFSTEDTEDYEERTELIVDSNCNQEVQIKELHQGLDNILDKLQKMLASNFSLAESTSGQEHQELIEIKVKDEQTRNSQR